MNIEYIKQKLEKIDLVKGDFEQAHSLEDDLMIEFIGFVSEHIINDSCDYDLHEMAKELLKVKNIDFPRYCA